MNGHEFIELYPRRHVRVPASINPLQHPVHGNPSWPTSSTTPVCKVVFTDPVFGHAGGAGARGEGAKVDKGRRHRRGRGCRRRSQRAPHHRVTSRLLASGEAGHATGTGGETTRASSCTRGGTTGFPQGRASPTAGRGCSNVYQRPFRDRRPRGAAVSCSNPPCSTPRSWPECSGYRPPGRPRVTIPLFDPSLVAEGRRGPADRHHHGPCRSCSLTARAGGGLLARPAAVASGQLVYGAAPHRRGRHHPVVWRCCPRPSSTRAYGMDRGGLRPHLPRSRGTPPGVDHCSPRAGRPLFGIDLRINDLPRECAPTGGSG